MSEREDKIEELIQTGAEITGGLAGIAVELITHGTTLGAAGVASTVFITKSISKVGNSIKQRLYGNRDEARVGAALTYAAIRIKENIDSGLVPRKVDEFAADENTRSIAEELLEGVLLAAEKEFEEKKLKYLGNLYGNVMFDTKMARETAVFLLKLAQRISWRQYCLINIHKNREQHQLNTKADPNSVEMPFQVLDASTIHQTPMPVVYVERLEKIYPDLGQEIKELEDLRILKHDDALNSHLRVIGEVTEIGATLNRLMRLDDITREDIENTLKYIRVKI